MTSGDDTSERVNPVAALEARLRELSALLHTEFDAIRRRDIAEITQLSAAKQELVVRINESMADSTGALNELLHTAATDQDSDLFALLHECHHANRINGAAIESSQSFAASLLDILRGRTPGQRIYTARGRLGLGGESGTLIRV